MFEILRENVMKRPITFIPHYLIHNCCWVFEASKINTVMNLQRFTLFLDNFCLEISSPTCSIYYKLEHSKTKIVECKRLKSSNRVPKFYFNSIWWDVFLAHFSYIQYDSFCSFLPFLKLPLNKDETLYNSKRKNPSTNLATSSTYRLQTLPN